MILLTGGNGQLGTELRHLLDEKGLKYVSTDAQEMDITDEQATLAFIQELKPTVIYHCAARRKMKARNLMRKSMSTGRKTWRKRRKR